MIFDLSAYEQSVVRQANEILEQWIVRRHMRVESTDDLAGYLVPKLFDEEQAICVGAEQAIEQLTVYLGSPAASNSACASSDLRRTPLAASGF